MKIPTLPPHVHDCVICGKEFECFGYIDCMDSGVQVCDDQQKAEGECPACAAAVLEETL